MARLILRRPPQPRKPEASPAGPPPATTPAPPAPASPTPEIPLASLTIRTAGGGRAFTGADVARLLDLAERSPGRDSQEQVQELTDPGDALFLLAGVAEILDGLAGDEIPWETSHVLGYVVRHARARLWADMPSDEARAAAAGAAAARYVVTVPPAEPPTTKGGPVMATTAKLKRHGRVTAASVATPAQAPPSAPLEGTASSDPHGYHAVGLALSKAHAALWLLGELEAGEHHIEPADENAAWARQIAADALRAALAEAERAFRACLTREQALAQLVGGPPSTEVR